MRVFMVVTPAYDVSAILLEVRHREQGALKRNGKSSVGGNEERKLGKEVRSAELPSSTVKDVLFDPKLSDPALIN
jgi:hypothetical protein